MRRILATALLALLPATSADAQSGIALRDMGSFHVGGRHIEVKGQPVKEVVFDLIQAWLVKRGFARN